MAINTFLKINGTPIQKMLKEYKVDYNLLWADSDRSMDGSIHATLIGEFPKIELKFKDGMSQAEVSQVGNLLSQPFLNIEYWDSRNGQMASGQFYRNDYSVEILDARRQLYKSFSVNLIPTRRR